MTVICRGSTVEPATIEPLFTAAIAWVMSIKGMERIAREDGERDKADRLAAEAQSTMSAVLRSADALGYSYRPDILDAVNNF